MIRRAVAAFVSALGAVVTPWATQSGAAFISQSGQDMRTQSSA